MTELHTPSTQFPQVGTPPPESAGRFGWVRFAAIMLFLGGLYHAVAGLVALFEHNYYLVTTDNLVLHMDYTVWGWIHLITGVIALIAGFAVMVGQLWARVFGIALAFLSALVNLAFLSAYPIWGVIMIAIDVLVIYALAVHGREAPGLD